MKLYCYYCDKEVDYTVSKEKISITIDNEVIEYIATIAKCNICGNELQHEQYDKLNVGKANEIYRKKKGIISVDEIQNILRKYGISAKVLAKLLGWGEATIHRYLNGMTPLPMYSDKLKLLKDTYEMKKLVEENSNLPLELKQKIIANINNIMEEEKKVLTIDVEMVVDYIITFFNENDDTVLTPLKLQKLLYYIQGWHLSFYSVPIFLDPIEAWEHGPVIRKIYNKYKEYGCNPIIDMHKNNVNIALLSKKIIDNVCKYFGIFDGKFLERMTHKEKPWRQAYELGVNTIITQDNLKSFFDEIRLLFDIASPDKLKKYINHEFIEIEY